MKTKNLKEIPIYNIRGKKAKSLREIPRYIVELTAQVAGESSACQKVLDNSKEYKNPKFFKDGKTIIVIDWEE